MDIARALRFQVDIPIKYWGLCVKTGVYLINRLPSSVLQGKTPYEIMYKRRNHIDHLRVFGCLCYATNVVKSDKFAERARETILMGYFETQKGYLLLDLTSNTFFVSRHDQFKEHIFPFRKKLSDTTLESSYTHMEQDAVRLSPLIDTTYDNESFGDFVNVSGSEDVTEKSGEIQEDLVVGEFMADNIQVDEHAEVNDMPRDTMVQQNEAQYTRKSHRKMKEPIWMEDYAVNKRPTLVCILLPTIFPMKKHLQSINAILANFHN